MTHYIAAYDTERAVGNQHVPSCLDACRRIVEIHRRHQMPATFFVVGKLLEAQSDAYRRLLDDPLFEIASHTWSHRMLRDQPFCGPGVTGDDLRTEIFRGREAIHQAFPDRSCIGLRPGCCWPDGLRGAPHVLQLVHEAGFSYVSSVLWGPDFTLPAPLNQASDYRDDGFPNLREYPGHGWHDNALKSMSRPGYWTEPKRLLAFPPLFPETIPTKPIATPDDEFNFNSKPFIDRARRQNLPYVSLIWHPWSLGAFDPQMRMLDLTFSYVRQHDLIPTTYADIHRNATASPP